MMKIIYFFGTMWMAQMMACSSPNTVEDEHAHDEHQEGHAEEGEVVLLNDVQIASVDIKTRTGFDTLNISGFIKANGNFDLPPENIAAITAPMQGTVKRANYLVGSYVKRGATLVVLEHSDYIEMQAEYLNSVNNIEYLKAEYERQKRLDSANVTARKAFQQAEATYKSAETKKLSLEKQLEYIGINPATVLAGKISSTIAVRAPFSGYITMLNVHKGQFVNPQQELYELIDKDHMHLELSVYEKDIFGLREGQPLQFTVPGIGPESYKGEVFLVGQSFDKKSKTVKVHGHIEEMKPQFIPGLYLEATIFTGNEEVRALPEQAIVRDGGKTYIFIKHSRQSDTVVAHHNDEAHDHNPAEQQHQHEDKPADHGHEQETEVHAHDEKTAFTRIEVVTGINRNGMVEIRSVADLEKDAPIVIEGAYDLLSEMKKGEGGHHH